MILVTGGAGFIGSNLVASLNERGVSEIAVGDHLDAAKAPNLAKRRYAEIVAPDDILRWLQGRKCEAILHMGAISSTTATDEGAVMAANYDLPMQLLEWCAATKTPLIYASSAATYGDGRLGFSDDDRPQGRRLCNLERRQHQCDTAAAASSETSVSVWNRSSSNGAIRSGVRPVATSSASVVPTIGAALNPYVPHPVETWKLSISVFPRIGL